MSDEEDDFWHVFRPIAVTIGCLTLAFLLVTGTVECSSRVFRAYDRWECRQWCGSKGAKSWSPSGGCECKP